MAAHFCIGNPCWICYPQLNPLANQTLQPTKPAFGETPSFTILRRCKCIKSLHKRTYKGLAFKNKHTYFLVEDDGKFYWLLDDQGHSFSFIKNVIDEENNVYYKFEDYFKIIED